MLGIRSLHYALLSLWLDARRRDQFGIASKICDARNTLTSIKLNVSVRQQ